MKSAIYSITNSLKQSNITFPDASGNDVLIVNNTKIALTDSGYQMAVRLFGSANVNLIGGGANSGSLVQTTVSVAVTSTKILDANIASVFLKLKVNAGASNGIWVRWDGAVATAAAPSEYLAPGETAVWLASDGFLPTTQINAIAAGTTPITVIYK